MAIVVKNTNYNGEVLEQILTLAATGNEIVEKGLIMIIPGVEKKISLPRLKSGKMLQKRKEHPGIEDSKGNFNYSEKSLDPVDFMAFTVFNPRAFEQIWRKWQPKGNLVFAELPPEGQNALLAELTKQVKFELGDHFINGTYGDDDDHLMNGILTQMTKDTELIIVSGKPATMLEKLKAVRKAIPVAIRNNPNLRIIMSVNDFDKYDDELTERERDDNKITVEVLGGGVIRDFAQSEKTTIDLEAGYYDISSEEFPEDMWEGHDFLVFVAGTKANPITANTRVRIICGSLTQNSAVNNRIYLDNFYIRRLQEVEEDYFAENNGSGKDIILGAPFDEEEQE